MTARSNRFASKSRRKNVLFPLMLSLIGIQIVALLTIGFGHSLDSMENDILQSFDSLSWFYHLSKHGFIIDEEIQGHHDEFIQIDLPPEFHQGRPLDDYYTRKHVVNRKIPIVVGGSDGSGTRVFVDALKKLGVPMIIDDEGSFDFHARTSFQGQGWPPFAKLALKYGNHSSLQYEPSSFPSDVLDEIEGEMNRIRSQLSRRAKNLELQQRGKNLSQTSVSYGFKAPVTLLLLPLIEKYLFPDIGFKYLHVVRDGRDVALSKNQSPVKKFYRDYYGNVTASNNILKFNSIAHALAMQLWNDCNFDAYEWEKRQAASNNNEKFDFLVMRTEDLLHPNSKPRALKQLADFVGSEITDRELCCQSQLAVSDMGASSVVSKFGHGMPDLMHRKEFYDQKLEKEEFMKQFAKTAGKENFADLSREQRLLGMKQFLEREHNEKHHVAVPNVAEDGKLSEERHNFFLKRLMQHRADRKKLQKRRLLEDSMTSNRNRLYENYAPPKNQGNKTGQKRHHLTDEDYGDQVLGDLLEGQLERLKAAAATNKITGNDSQHPPSISSRYGKWDALLSTNSELLKTMNEEGAQALKSFGYDPPRQFMDQPPTPIVCDKNLACF